MTIPPPAFGCSPSHDQIVEDISRWLAAPALHELLTRFGGPTPANVDDLDHVAEWAATHWDFRSGRERNLVHASEVAAGDEELIVACADELGLVTPRKPERDSYDAIAMLGGLIRACVWRPEYAAHLVAQGVRANSVAAISGFRTLNDAETVMLPAFGLNGVTEEHQVMEGALRTAFGIDTMDDRIPLDETLPPNLRHYVRTGQSSSGVPAMMVVAPSTDPSRRANTPDGYTYWSTEVAHLRPGDRVLLVTTQIYLPFQHADAIRILGLTQGCIIETVGVDRDAVDDRGHDQPFTGVNYLQEINSTLRSYRGLIAVVEGQNL